jgi:hypothetical protein
LAVPLNVALKRARRFLEKSELGRRQGQMVPQVMCVLASCSSSTLAAPQYRKITLRSMLDDMENLLPHAQSQNPRCVGSGDVASEDQ